MSSSLSADRYVSGREVARTLGIPRKAVDRLAARGLLTVKHLPGMHAQYLIEDVERLARLCLRPATASVEASA